MLSDLSKRPAIPGEIPTLRNEREVWRYLTDVTASDPKGDCRFVHFFGSAGIKAFTSRNISTIGVGSLNLIVSNTSVVSFLFKVLFKSSLINA